ncbi:MAG TPA: FAD:protein FMN transferase, partial [Pirellulaceae bacterium]|nr:FAD:protein FMN transferase [Pirellulaceae bacterium]
LLLNPATGQSPSQLASVSIAAPTALEADALSTACFVLGVDAALALLISRGGCDALFVTKTGRVIATPGFPQVHEETHHG